jgi:hypothetical protein
MERKGAAGEVQVLEERAGRVKLGDKAALKVHAVGEA